MRKQRMTHLLGYRCELILADSDGKTFVVNGAIYLPEGSPSAQVSIDVERVMQAIDERAMARQPTFREVKITDA